jgi:hypothetical protein
MGLCRVVSMEEEGRMAGLRAEEQGRADMEEGEGRGRKRAQYVLSLSRSDPYRYQLISLGVLSLQLPGRRPRTRS